MINRKRLEPLELIFFKYLSSRMALSDTDFWRYQTLKKGYEGEKKSDIWLQDLSDEWIVLHDLLLEYNQSKFQIDTLIFTYEKIHLLDVKNYEGDYTDNGENWSTETNLKVQNPLHQLNRCEILLSKLLHSLGCHYPIESHLIFIHPEFHLYQTSINPKIIFPAQLNRFMKKLNSRPVKLSDKYLELAEQIISMHIVQQPCMPPYSYDQLRKGIICPKCYSFYTQRVRNKLICGTCSTLEEVDSAVLRSVKEFMFLFPDQLVTTDIIHDWCSIVKSKKTIRRILSSNFKLVGHSKTANYIVYEDK
ncbi:nuclease-related domain-containing protein [Bacillus sp. MRMR6]|uniref:nuclease-related domain-containing protein n=1 Tax=Bacillus sp. MRMR6 TaxID=1928617 RepID=UPI0009533203|nr:nuclease-related domain-containing protein [Bacillus sp. MRMR6]OLS41343.1 hypothetical protein BTR25_05695 [Bacillus sp. MRMR6]